MQKPLSNSKKCLASLAVFRNLYNTNKDVYGVLAEFLKSVFIQKGRHASFNTSQMREFLYSMYDFTVPEAVVATALKRFCQRKDGLYSIIDTSKFKEIEPINQYYTETSENHNRIFSRLCLFVEEQKKKTLTEAEKELLTQDLCTFLIEDRTDTENLLLVSSFILKNMTDESFHKDLNRVKEGVVLYTGLQYSNNINEVGSWTTPLTIFAEQEILFHCAGYNGTLFKTLFDDFYQLVQEVNKKQLIAKSKPVIEIKYFPEVKAEIDGFFEAAEGIILGGKQEVFSPAMREILIGCSSIADVAQKKALFYKRLDDHAIVQVTDLCYDPLDFPRYNIENQTLINEMESAGIAELYPKLRLLNFVNILRGGNAQDSFVDMRYVLLTNNGGTLDLARRITRDENNTLLATSLDYITNRLWFKLNRSFGNGEYPKTFDVITKAQIALSSELEHNIATEFHKLREMQKSGNFRHEQAVVILCELRKKPKKPEDISDHNIDSVFCDITSNDVERYLRERELEKKRAVESEERNKKLEKELADEKTKRMQHEVTIIDNALKKLQSAKDVADQKINVRVTIAKFLPAMFILLYAFVSGFCIYIFSWDAMSPYLFMAGLVYSAIVYAICAYLGHGWDVFRCLKMYEISISNQIYKEMEIDIKAIQELKDSKLAQETLISSIVTSEP